MVDVILGLGHCNQTNCIYTDNDTNDDIYSVIIEL